MYACPNYWSVYVEGGKIILLSKGLFIWYRNDSFYLHIILCICLHDIKKTYRSYTSRVHAGFHSHWNCRSGMKFIISSCKLKTNFVPDLESQIMWSVESEACISKLLRKLREQEHLRLSHLILACECSMNFFLEQNSFWNKVFPVS